MSRFSWPIIILVGILALLGLTYASLPMIFTGLLKHTLTTRGLNDVQISIGYPDWHRIRLYELRFTARAGAQHVYCELTDADVEYRITDLLTGKAGKIRVPVTVVNVQPRPGVTPPVQSTAALPLAALISGQWLAKLPVRELWLENLTVDWRTPADAVYRFDLSGKVHDAAAQLDGNITLPTPQPRHVAVSLIAHKTGQARLAFAPSNNRAEPMLVLAVNKVAIEPTQIALNGTLNAKLGTLLPWLDPWLIRSDWMAGLGGDFKSTWLAVLPGSPNEAGRLMLPPLYGKGSNWQVTGEAKVQGLRGQWGDQPVLHGELFARFEADPQQATVQTTLRTAGQAVELEASGQHQFTSGKGHADIRLVPVEFTDSGFVLSQLVEQWPYPFDISNGRLAGSGRLDWQTAQATTLQPQWVMQLDKLAGHLSLIHISEPTRQPATSRMPSSA